MRLINKNKYVLTVTLNPAIDHFIIDGKEICLAGGKGINVSRALKNLGVNTLATGFVGGKTGLQLKSFLNREKISHDFLTVNALTRTNITKVNKQGVSHRKLGEGENLGDDSIQPFIQKYKRLSKNALAVIISGRNASGVSPKIYFDLIKIAKEFGLKVFVDTSSSALLWSIKANPTLIKFNQEEFCDVFNIKKFSIKSSYQYLNWLHRKGIEYVLLSLAKQGAIGSSGQQKYWIVAPKVKKAFDVGCGDSMLAGFVSKNLKGKSLWESLLMATACGTQNAHQLVPGKINQKNVKNILIRCKLKKLFYSAEYSH